MVLATHELDEAERCADDVVVFDEGRVVHQSSLAEMLGSTQTIRFSTSSPIDDQALARALSATIRRTDEGYVLDGSSDTSLISRIDQWLNAQGISLTAVSAGGRRLEDAVLDLRRRKSS